ncbi:FliM/FliN family flagellar motor switch protein [Enterobacter ludwigii]|jgi:type III secretion protein Q
MLNIRRLQARQIEVIRWQQRFQPNRGITEPQAGERYFQLLMASQAEQVQALILIEAWSSFRWPELACCAWEAMDDAAMVSLFRSEYEGHAFFSGTFRVVSLQIVDGEQVSQPWLTVEEASLGTVLLSSPVNPLNAAAEKQWLMRRIKLQADWVLGSSYISVGLLQTLALGDVLCIQQLRLHLSVADCPVASFQKNQEGVFVIEENIDEMQDEPEAFTLPDESTLELSPGRFDPTKITVKLTFVLGSSDIPLAELEHIQPGAVYSIGPDKEKEVKVFANKQLIAEGELIYIGDGEELGLEVIRLAGMGCVES